MLVSHLLYARIHLSTSVILPACLTDAAWKLGIFIQLLSVCQSREMLFTQHQLDEVQHALCVTSACSTHSENKDKVWPVPPGCLHFSWPHIVCVGVCNSSRVISLQSSSSRAESYWEIFCIFMTRNTNHNAFILLYRKTPQNKTLGTLEKTETVFFLLCWAVRSASLEGRNTKAIIWCSHDNNGENCSVKIFTRVIFVGQQMQEHMIHNIYFLMI